jgi:hypothetical protein
LLLSEPSISKTVASAERPVVPDILEEHLEELAYLSIQRRKLLFSAELPLRRLQRHAARMEAHLDGLRVGCPASVDIASLKLNGDNLWFIAAAAQVWLQLGRPAPEAVAERLAEVPAEVVPAWKEAFRKLNPGSISDLLPQRIFDQARGTALPIFLDALGWHGLLAADAAARLSSAADPDVRFSIARFATEPALIARCMGDPDPRTHRAALWQLALQNPAMTLQQSRAGAQSGSPDLFDLRILGLFGERTDGQLLCSFLNRPQFALAAVEALVALAQPEFFPALLDFLDPENEELAAASCEAFRSMIGCLPPAATQPPQPDAVRIRKCWAEHHREFDLAQRRLGGNAFPWKGIETEQPMVMLWRLSLASPKPETAWLRREVPDGFFTGERTFESIPGE